MDIDDFERAKKRAKVEKILSLTHADGIPSFYYRYYFFYTILGIEETLDMPGSNSADKDEKMTSP